MEGDEFKLKSMAHCMDRFYFSYYINAVVPCSYKLCTYIILHNFFGGIERVVI